MTPHEQDQLLKELLAGEEISDFRRTSLDRGIALVRLRRKRRQMAQRAVMVCVPLLLLLLLFIDQIPKLYLSGPATSQTYQPIPPPVQVGDTSEIKLINDDELFALFAGRSIALIGKPGEQQLVFLDGPQFRRSAIK
jgi:hypothetical protein